MLELEDIEILPESLPPAATESTPVWMVAVAVAIVLVIAAVIVRALVSKANPSSTTTSTIDNARAEFLRVFQSLSQPNIAESFPTVVHAWANHQLEQRPALPQRIITEITTVRDLLAPHCYQPSTRWRGKIDPDTILSSLASALDVDTMNHWKGGETHDA